MIQSWTRNPSYKKKRQPWCTRKRRQNKKQEQTLPGVKTAVIKIGEQQKIKRYFQNIGSRTEYRYFVDILRMPNIDISYIFQILIIINCR